MQTALGGFDFEWRRPTGRVALVEAPKLVDNRPYDPLHGPYLVAFGMEFETIGFSSLASEPLSAHGLWRAWLEDAGNDASLYGARARAASIVAKTGFPYRFESDAVDLVRGAHPFHWVDSAEGTGIGVAWRGVKHKLHEIATFERTRHILADARNSIQEREIEGMVAKGATDQLFVVLPGDDPKRFARASRRIVAEGAMRVWRDPKPSRADRCRRLVLAWMATHLNGQLARTTAAGVPTALGAPHSPVSLWPLDLFGAMWMVTAQHFVGERAGGECANCRQWFSKKRSDARYCDRPGCRKAMSPKRLAKRMESAQ